MPKEKLQCANTNTEETVNTVTDTATDNVKYSKDTRSRRYLLVINNPKEKGLDHDAIKGALAQREGLIYYIMSDEIGEKGTYHTHLYVVFKNAVRFSTLSNSFHNSAHFEIPRGNSEQNKAYVEKSGKWTDTDKAETRVEGTIEEWGELPDDSRTKGSEWHIILEKIKDGATNSEILNENPEFMRYLSDVERTRQTLLQDERKNEWRNLEVIFISGKTALGKTRYVLDKHGYSEVYRVTNYKNPFDSYAGQSVLVFDEFDDKHFPIQQMNNYLDGYPLSLPARYADKVACYTTVYIISNTPLYNLYQEQKASYRDLHAAFIRRIHKVMHFTAVGIYTEYDVREYLAAKGKPKPDKPLAKTYPPITSDAPPVKVHNTTNIAELLQSAKNAEPVDLNNVEL